VTLTWDAVTGVKYLAVYRADVDDSASAVLLNTTAADSTFYDDHTALPGRYHYYWVKAVVKAKRSRR